MKELRFVPSDGEMACQGRLRSFDSAKGFGFIESEEFSKAFKGDSDVFLHHFQKRHGVRGAWAPGSPPSLEYSLQPRPGHPKPMRGCPGLPA